MGGVLYAEEGEEGQRSSCLPHRGRRVPWQLPVPRCILSQPLSDDVGIGGAASRCCHSCGIMMRLPRMKLQPRQAKRTAAVPSDSDSQSTPFQQLRQTRMAAPVLALPRITPPSTYSIATTCADPWPTRNNHLGPSHRPMPSHRRHLRKSCFTLTMPSSPRVMALSGRLTSKMLR